MSPLLLDTSGWLLALAGEPDYAAALEEADPAIVPSLVLAEVDYHLRGRRRAMQRVLGEIAAGAYQLEALTIEDLARAATIDQKFSSLKLGLVDASIVALAERLDTRRLLTTDGDFASVRVGSRWNRALEFAVPLPIRR